MSDKVARIADKVAADWGARAAYTTLQGEWRPADLREAYAVQGAVQERLAGRHGAVAGRKIALSSKAMQEMVGIAHPLAGAFFAGDVRWSPAEVDVSGFRHLGVEFELAFELGADVAPGAGPFDGRSVRRVIAGVRPAFELVDDLGADYAAIDAFSLVAANAWCGGVVLGEAIPGLGGARRRQPGGHGAPGRARARADHDGGLGPAGLARLGAEPFRGAGGDAGQGRARHHGLGGAHALSAAGRPAALRDRRAGRRGGGPGVMPAAPGAGRPASRRDR
jgi:hypothetical protein